MLKEKLIVGGTGFTTINKALQAASDLRQEKLFLRFMLKEAVGSQFLMRINNIKLELRTKRIKQVMLANRPETASVSVHERA